MEGLIPLVYKAITQYRNGGQGGITGTWLDESPSYMRLPGDSGRFSTADVHVFRPDCGFSACSPAQSAGERVVSTTIQSTGQHHLVNSFRAVK